MPLTQDPEPTKEYLEVEDVAEVLHMHPETVREMLREKKIPGRKIGRKWLTSRKQLDEFIRDEQSCQEEE